MKAHRLFALSFKGVAVNEFFLPSVVDWDYPKDARPPQGRAQHFDVDRKPVEDLSRHEEAALQRDDAHAHARAALACQRHLRDLRKHHGNSGYPRLKK
jgi:hypothetical protein